MIKTPSKQTKSTVLAPPPGRSASCIMPRQLPLEGVGLVLAVKDDAETWVELMPYCTAAAHHNAPTAEVPLMSGWFGGLAS